jgi:hypothetical protein
MIHYSLHKIDDVSTIPFSENEYSKFKFGDESIAEKFGIELATGFIENIFSTIEIPEDIVVFSSPYDFIPTASYYMKQYFVYHLNLWLVKNEKNVLVESKIYRTTTYKEDYGALSAEDRLKLIGNDSFYIDKNFIEGKFLIFIDDIKITGSHEYMIRKMISEFDLKNEFAMIYFSELVNKNIDPQIENYLNYHYVNSLREIDEIIATGRFAFNTRVVKYILNSNQKDFSNFISTKTEQFKKQLINFAIGNKYHLMSAYKFNYEELMNNVYNNQKIEYGY